MQRSGAVRISFSARCFGAPEDANRRCRVLGVVTLQRKDRSIEDFQFAAKVGDSLVYIHECGLVVEGNLTAAIPLASRKALVFVIMPRVKSQNYYLN